MISRIYIDNFRCFSNFELVPGRVNLLFGANGSGKTSLMEILDRVVFLAVEGREVDELFSESDLTLWDSRAQLRVELDFEIEAEPYGYRLTLARRAAGAGMEIEEEWVTAGERTLFVYQDGQVHLHRNDGSEGPHFPFRGTRSFLAGIESRLETVDLTKFLAGLGEIRRYKLEPMRMVSTTHEEDPALSISGDNFPSWYRHLSQERAGDLPGLFEDLGEAVRGFKALVLKGAGKQGRTRDLLVQMHLEGGGAYELDFESLSDGQRVLVVLYTLLIDISETGRTVFLDEPENYVGLSELQPWLQELDAALGDQGQLFLISHHPEVIDFFAPENPILFERPGGGPVRVKRAEFELDQGLKASTQIARGFFDEP